MSLTLIAHSDLTIVKLDAYSAMSLRSFPDLLISLIKTQKQEEEKRTTSYLFIFISFHLVEVFFPELKINRVRLDDCNWLCILAKKVHFKIIFFSNLILFVNIFFFYFRFHLMFLQNV